MLNAIRFQGRPVNTEPPKPTFAGGCGFAAEPAFQGLDTLRFQGRAESVKTALDSAPAQLKQFVQGKVGGKLNLLA